MASLRGLKTTTVVSHLCEAIKVGLEVDPVRVGVTSQIESLITRVIRGPEINSGGWKNSQKSTQVCKKLPEINSGWEKCPEIIQMGKNAQKLSHVGRIMQKWIRVGKNIQKSTQVGKNTKKSIQVGEKPRKKIKY